MMKKAVFLLLALCAPYIVYADHGLTPVGFVNDYANVLSSETKETLEQELQKFEKETTAEIAFASIPSLKGEAIEAYAVGLFEEWKIGKEEKNNGVLLLIALEERQVRIEVGYGLEPFITDGRAGRIIRNDITPSFKEGDYNKGVQQGVARIKEYILAGQPEQPQEAVRDVIGRTLPGLFDNQLVFFLLIFLLIYAVDYMSRSKSIWFGGAFGGGLGVFLGWLFISTILGIFLFFALGALGLLLDYILSRNYQVRKAKGLPVDFWSSRGGFWGGGGGFRGGGGFGGFGGGMSGGGGASGRW